MRLADWLDRDAVANRLIERGLSRACAENAAPCFAEAAVALGQDLGEADDVIGCWAPGRIEVLGKHTDYCGGESIVAAVERGFCMLAVPRDGPTVSIVDPNHTFREIVVESKNQPVVGHWSNYPHTVVCRIDKNFPRARRGATIAFASNLPPSSGMSSSSALIVGTFMLLAEINQLGNDPTYTNIIQSSEDLAAYLSTVENGKNFGPLAGDRGVGTFGGSEDHTAILCSQPNRLVQYGYCPVQFRRSIEVCDDYVFVIASSGVVAEKTGTALEKYNRVSRSATTIVEIWKSTTRRQANSLAEIVRSAPDAADELRTMLRRTTHTNFTAQELVGRLDHFVIESKLVAAVPNSIDSMTINQFGKLAAESHETGARLLKNQAPETLRLVEIANQLGAPAASAFGAGFGGSVWAIVDHAQSAQWRAEWYARYQNEFPEAASRSTFFPTRAGAAGTAIV
jgi:galactokinase